jgi:5'-nucleotidase / UDP-sugar diphosphatase
MIIKGQKVTPSFRPGLNRMAKIVLAGFSMAQPKTMTKRKFLAVSQKQKYKQMKKLAFLSIILFLIFSCSKNDGTNEIIPNEITTKNLTIFFVNDQHGQLDNFSKIKQIVDKEKQETNVLIACSGDMFSGNPVVDNYEEKGYPMIDVMNKVEFDISVLGNHEFDYGESVLKDRMEQAEFVWVCANVDMGSTGIPEPLEYKTINIGDLKITFLGLVETDGKENATIPMTHPGKIQNLTFERPENVVSQYSNIKEQENSDLYIALTHLGHQGFYGGLGDFQLAEQFPYFDLIIGGHTNQKLDTVVNNIHVYQAGCYLNYLGKIVLSVKNKKIESAIFDLIELNNYTDYDTELKSVIDEYNNNMSSVLDEVIGFSHFYHEKYKVGCFYTDALRDKLNVDVTFQNTGGVRSSLDEGDITIRKIYEIDPFNNGTLIYNMSVTDIKNFLIGTSSGFYYSGIQIEQIGMDVQINDLNGNIIPDNNILSLGINDYIPAVHDIYFPTNVNIQSFTTAEAIIFYLVNINSDVSYPDCDHYFRYQYFN